MNTIVTNNNIILTGNVNLENGIILTRYVNHSFFNTDEIEFLELCTK